MLHIEKKHGAACQMSSVGNIAEYVLPIAAAARSQTSTRRDRYIAKKIRRESSRFSMNDHSFANLKYAVLHNLYFNWQSLTSASSASPFVTKTITICVCLADLLDCLNKFPG